MKNEGIFYMLKKLKKHKLSLFLLAMVCMLSVYYILMPTDSDPNLPVSKIEGEVRNEEFAKMRLDIIDERNTEVALYESKIVDVTTGLEDIERYVLEIEKVQAITEREVYIEGVIINLGYEDSLVYLDEFENLHISVLADKFDVKDYIEVALLAKDEFGSKTLVTVNLVTEN
jgi:hypothetical protein